MKKVLEEERHCEICQIKTTQLKNSVTLNWILHISLTLISFGIYLVLFVYVLITHLKHKSETAMCNIWVCTNCNNKPLFGGK